MRLEKKLFGLDVSAQVLVEWKGKRQHTRVISVV